MPTPIARRGREVLAPVASDGLGPVTVLRDYHAENIMLVEGREGVAHFGLLDFQDALAGHPAYDLASVLEDARRDVPPAIERAMIDRYVAATGHGEAFERAYWALAAQRNTRILGVFTRLWKRDGKPHYRRFQPRMWGLLERDLAQPASGAGARTGSTPTSRPSIAREPWRAGRVSQARRALRLRAEVPAEVPRTAMIMAAGLGKRMRPLTATRPKPLIEVGGKALLDHVLDQLRAAGVEEGRRQRSLSRRRARSASRRAATTGSKWSISDERELLLETGGGLVQAAPLIDSDPFLALNSDNLWVDGPADTLKLLASHWDDDEDGCAAAARAAGAGAQPQGAWAISTWTAPGRLRRRERSHVAPFVFTGIQIVSKRLLRDAPEGPFSTNILWDRAIEEGRCFGAVHQGLWFDVGTPQSIQLTEAALENV